MANLGDAERLFIRMVRAEENLAGEREGLNALAASGKEQGLEPSVMKLAMKLDKMKPLKLDAWLDTFDTIREARKWGAQTDIVKAAALAAHQEART